MCTAVVSVLRSYVISSPMSLWSYTISLSAVNIRLCSSSSSPIILTASELRSPSSSRYSCQTNSFPVGGRFQRLVCLHSQLRSTSVGSKSIVFLDHLHRIAVVFFQRSFAAVLRHLIFHLQINPTHQHLDLLNSDLCNAKKSKHTGTSD